MNKNTQSSRQGIILLSKLHKIRGEKWPVHFKDKFVCDVIQVINKTTVV